MTILVIAEHDNASIKAATLNTVAAASKIGGDIHVLVAGSNAQGAADAAAKIAGVAKVLLAEQSSRTRIGLMLPDAFESPALGHDILVYRWGRWNNYEELARRLFAGLRWLDAASSPVPMGP